MAKTGRERQRWGGEGFQNWWGRCLGLCSSLCVIACEAELGNPAAGSPGSRTIGGASGTEERDRDEDPDSEVVLNEDNPGGEQLSCDRDADLAESQLLKLSTRQYRNTVLDLLDRYDLNSLRTSVDALLDAIPDDTLGSSFRGLDDRIELNHVQASFKVGLLLGDAVRDDSRIRERVMGPCSNEAADASCWDSFVNGFLQTIYRRQLSREERQGFDELIEDGAGLATAARSAIVIAMSSPRFIYHVETDGEELSARPDLLALDAYEVASRLSYTFWQTMPDEELLAHARDGSLLETEVYEQQLLRVWEDDRTLTTISQFWLEWLRLEKFTGFESGRPAFQALTDGHDFETHDYYADMVQEVSDLTRYFTFEAKGSLADLLSTPLSLTQSEPLATLYGIEPWDGRGDFPRFDPEERAGLLQRAALLVSNLEQTNPFHRGALIRRAILCDSLQQPDPNQLPAGSLDPPEADEARTTRQRFAEKVEGNGLCERCHIGFSDIGYVLESYDALGRFRTVEKVLDEQTGRLLAELPIDTHGDVRISGPQEAPVRSASELNQRIIDSGKVEACMAERYLEFFTRRATTRSMPASSRT